MKFMVHLSLLFATSVGTFANADCVNSFLCSSYDYALPVNITNSTSAASLTVMGGNVGFGTTNPQYLLDAKGNVHFGDPAYADLWIIMGGPWDFGSGNVYGDAGMANFQSAGGITFGTANKETVRIVGNRVGVGTTTPAATLSVNGFAQLKVYSSAPIACVSNLDGSIALNSHYTTCVCNGGANGWVLTSDGATACTW